MGLGRTLFPTPANHDNDNDNDNDDNDNDDDNDDDNDHDDNDHDDNDHDDNDHDHDDNDHDGAADHNNNGRTADSLNSAASAAQAEIAQRLCRHVPARRAIPRKARQLLEADGERTCVNDRLCLAG